MENNKLLDLETLFKCLDRDTKIYIKDYDDSVSCCDRFTHPNRWLSKYQLFITDIPQLIDGYYIVLDLDDYGETWSLNREDLE